MADDDAARQRRSRLHKAGDHSSCLVGRCDAAPGSLDVKAVGPVEAAMLELVNSLRIDLHDPRATIGAAGLALARAVDREVNTVAAARELRLFVEWLNDGDRQNDVLHEVRARRATRRVGQLLGYADTLRVEP